jgi:hypothetical protein
MSSFNEHFFENYSEKCDTDRIQFEGDRLMARSSRGGGGVSLPWEQRGARLRELLTGRRWGVLLLAAALLFGLYSVWRSVELRQKERQTATSIALVQRALTAFRSDMGRCPHTLEELVHPPRSGARYLRAVPVDGWGRALWVRCPGRYDPEGADVISAGQSGSYLVDDNLP